MKRKDARKRKFEGQNCLSQPDTGVQSNSEGISPDHPPKKSRHTIQPTKFSENVITTGRSMGGKLGDVNGSTDWGKIVSASTANQKAQRFIVFIGPSNHFVCDHFSRLTLLFPF